MLRRSLMPVGLIAVLLLAVTGAGLAQDLAPIILPAPVMTGGKPLMQALKDRASAREFSPDKLPAQTVSNLLWAAWGINRPDGRRTAPSASNKQEIDIYVTLPDGAFVWDAKANTLNPVAAGDLRGATGTQPFPATAGLNLVYVADMVKTGRPSTDPQQMLNVLRIGGAGHRGPRLGAERHPGEGPEAARHADHRAGTVGGAAEEVGPVE